MRNSFPKTSFLKVNNIRQSANKYGVAIKWK